MIGRVMNVFGRSRGEAATRPLRPNELSRNVIQAERQRRKDARGELLPSESTPTRDKRQARERREHQEPRLQARSRLTDSLRSKSGLRRAWLAKEILGPPRSLQSHKGGQSEPRG